MNRLFIPQTSRFRCWLYAAIAVLVMGQASISGHVHANTQDVGDCYVCQHGQDQEKNLPQAIQQQFFHSVGPGTAVNPPEVFVNRSPAAASIRAPPVLLHG